MLIRSRLVIEPVRPVAVIALIETMLRDGMLSRLYLTLAHCLAGGEGFHTMIAGPELGPAGRLRLAALYQETADDGRGQWFAQFETERRSTGRSE